MAAFGALNWLTYEHDHLTTDGLLRALTIQVDGIRDDRLTVQTLLGVCRNLVEYSLEFHRFRLAHVSVREFFEGKGVKYLDGHAGIALTCMLYLLTDIDFDNASLIDASCDLERYVAWDWPGHCHKHCVQMVTAV